jgi:hypothetical protein
MELQYKLQRGIVVHYGMNMIEELLGIVIEQLEVTSMVG